MVDAKKFGQFIQTMRKELGLTQEQLGEKLGVTDKAISRWERGVGFPDISLLEPLAQALGITVMELMRSERMEQPEIPAEKADQAVLRTLDLAQEQSRNRFRSRMLTFGLIPLVILADLFLSMVIDRYLDGPEWMRVLSIAVVSWGVLFGVLGIRYIAACRYAAPTKPRLPVMFWITTAMTCLGLTVVGIGFCVPGGKPKWFSLLVLLGFVMSMASPFYLYHLITDEMMEWNRWAGGRRTAGGDAWES